MTSRILLIVAIATLPCLCTAYPTLLDGLHEREIKGSQDILPAYDYIIVGGGTSGLVIGNRLSEDTGSAVLVIEYGYLDNNPSQIEPSSSSGGAWPRKDLYNLTSVPMIGLGNRTSGVYAAAVVGGGSTINGMMFDRGAAEDYDNWEKLGNPGWGWKGLLPYFKKSTTFDPPDAAVANEYNITYDASYYGTTGPIHASFPSYYWPGAKIQWQAFNDLGIPSNKEGAASGGGSGVYWNTDAMTGDKRQRSYARSGYYDPITSRKNFNLLTGYRVNEVQFSANLHADNITMIARDSPAGSNVTTVKANKEIILCAGWLHTPQILQRSGIGPKAVLNAANVTVLVDLPGVGANFQDHMGSRIAYQYNTDAQPNPQSFKTNSTFNQSSIEQWKQRKGPLSLGNGNTVAKIGLPHITPTNYTSIITRLLSQTTQYLPSIYTNTTKAGWLAQRDLIAANYGGLSSAVVEIPFSGGSSASMGLEKPLSRGSITLSPSNIYAEPILDYGTLTNPVDLDIMISVFKFARRWYAAQTALSTVEVTPGVAVTSDEGLGDAVKESAFPSEAHGCCTAALMPKELGGVVCPELTVYGVSGLSVGDISVLPMVPGSHTCSTVYAVAEKAADLIKARHRTVYRP
ncbi:hypothetical protein G7Y89_g5373 [Cudoniella acicularis]|uniref:GMC oxidoreductase n=1 Tax=Cudoniella acicularis TaxID=354080 RepID=A0A8H4W424_9HELO|nr:hypothetical protein G7Y89_g5373 [Cudoniella acicularis]